MPPATVLTYGHPRGGTPVMLAHPHAALDLPLRVLTRVREDGRTARVISNGIALAVLLVATVVIATLLGRTILGLVKGELRRLSS